MKFLMILFILGSLSAFARTEANCELVDGIYKNSSSSLTDLRFETLVDVFTLNNANALILNLNGEELRFIRSNLSVSKQTKMIYELKKKNKVTRVAYMMIDRTPRKVVRTQEFYGNVVISEEVKPQEVARGIYNQRSYVYNFYCQF